MPDLIIAACIWEPNDNSLPFSRMYDEAWVEKLYRGFKRHCTVPFEFVCFNDKDRMFDEPIHQTRLTGDLNYGALIEPFVLNEPTIICGLDTIVTGNIDPLANYCLEAGKIAVPRDPFFPQMVCNGVALVPGGHAWVYDDWNGENDMDYIRSLDVEVIDDIFPGQVVSYKGHVKAYGLDDARIVYFHGEEKPHQLDHDWIDREWR